MLSAVVMYGVSLVFTHTLVGVGIDLDSTRQRIPVALLAVAMIGMMTGSFITQSAVKERRPWACSAGTTIFAALQVHSWTQAASLVIGVPIAVAIASLGARLYWHWYRPAAEPQEPELPPARLE